MENSRLTKCFTELITQQARLLELKNLYELLRHKTHIFKFKQYDIFLTQYDRLNILILEISPRLFSKVSISGHLKHAVQSLGKLEGVLTLLRAAPYHLRQRRVLLPTDLLMERDLSAEEVRRAFSRNSETPLRINF